LLRVEGLGAGGERAVLLLALRLQGYLGYKKAPPPPRGHRRVLGIVMW
jgi:hypothetical protein